MAKRKFITRTIKSTKASILCMDVETAEPLNKIVVLGGTFKDEKSILKEARKQIETETVKCVSVVDVASETALYKMDEQKFIENAEKIK